ncbi:hypothetical protein M9434_000103 [Picochlorum sp. BPE23]|nr:hypothetical protein M9434_000103 [Picochlorum sp. BPE23]
MEYQTTIDELTGNTVAQVPTRGKRESRLWLQLYKVFPPYRPVKMSSFFASFSAGLSTQRFSTSTVGIPNQGQHQG